VRLGLVHCAADSAQESPGWISQRTTPGDGKRGGLSGKREAVPLGEGCG
jgi:hypothetical protein